jgi:hypothetical protein
MPKRERGEAEPLTNKEIDVLMKGPLIDVIPDSSFRDQNLMIEPMDDDEASTNEFIKDLRQRGESSDYVPNIEHDPEYPNTYEKYMVMGPSKKMKYGNYENRETAHELDSIDVKGIEDTSSGEPLGGNRRKTRSRYHKKSNKKTHKRGHKKTHKRSHKKTHKRSHVRR